MPKPIPDTLEKVAKAVLDTKPKNRDDWKFVQEQENVLDGTGRPDGGMMGSMSPDEPRGLEMRKV